MLYVGRYSDEKGTEFFETIIEKWLEMGGQMVLMGIYTQDQVAKDIIQNLVTRQKNESLFSNNLKIYTDLYKDQLDFIPDTRIQKGKLIRFAANYICIPSKAESCGLVSMESLSLGTFVFTSWVQGLKDSCYPYGVYHPITGKVVDKDDFNTVSFEYSPLNKNKNLENINHSLGLAYALTTYGIINEDDHLTAQKRVINTANAFDWRSENGPLDQYIKLYSDLIGETIQPTYKSKLPKIQDHDQDHLVRTLVEKFGTYPEKKQVFVYDKYHPFLLTTLNVGKREGENQHNLPNLKELRRVTIKEKKLFLKSISGLEIFDTDTLKKQDNSFYITWVVNKRGELFAGAFCHAYFLKSKPGYPEYGYAKPVACGGDIIVKNGTIAYIDNRSGHYKPSRDQFLLVLRYLYSLGLLEKNTDIRDEYSQERISLQEIKTLDTSELLSRYSYLKDL